MGGYDPGRGMYDAGQVNALPRDGSRDQHDPGGSSQCHVGRRADGNAPDRFRYMDRDKVKHRGRASKKKIGRKKEKTEEEDQEEDRIVWKNRKRGKTRERKMGARSKKRGRMRKRVVLEKELGKRRCSGEGLEMMKNAAGIMMDMFEKMNAGSTADIEYATPPEVQRVASSFKETQAEFVSPVIEQRFGEMHSEFGESLNEVRSGLPRNTEAHDGMRSGQRKNTGALDEICSILRHLVPDSKSVLSSSPRNCFRCGKEGHFRKDCPMEIPSSSPAYSPNKSTF